MSLSCKFSKTFIQCYHRHLPIQILIHQNLHRQLHHQSLDTRYEQRQQLFQKVFICPNDVASYIPTTVLKGWLLNYCNICLFHQVSSSICLLGVQQKTVSTWWEQDKVDLLFLSFIFPSKLLEPQFVDVFAVPTIQTASVFF